jgi:hypothetical protein
MEPEVSLPLSKKSATGPYLKPTTPFHFFEINFNIIVAPKHISSELCLTFLFGKWIYSYMINVYH